MVDFLKRLNGTVEDLSGNGNDLTSPSKETTPFIGKYGIAYVEDKGFVEVPIIRGTESIVGLYNKYKDHAHFFGGFVRYMASPLVEPPEAGDIDIYPKSMEDYHFICKDLEQYLEVGMVTPVATTFKAKQYGRYAGVPPVQVVIPENKGSIVASGSLNDILGNFDFTVIRAGLKDMNTAIVDPMFIEDESNKFLRIKNIHCPISSTLRLMKYKKKGYSTNAGEILKLFNNWDEREPEYREALKTGLPKMNNTGADALSGAELTKLKTLIYVD